MDLKSLVVDSKEVWMDFPGMPGFEVKVANISRQELVKLHKSCEVQKFDRKARTVINTVDNEKFAKVFTDATVKGWKGLKLEYLEGLLLVDLTGQNPEDCLPFTEENAELLVSQSQEFDQWLNEVVFDLDNFRDRRKGKHTEAA